MALQKVTDVLMPDQPHADPRGSKPVSKMENGGKVAALNIRDISPFD
jgi:hypothetical protein